MSFILIFLFFKTLINSGIKTLEHVPGGRVVSTRINVFLEIFLPMLTIISFKGLNGFFSFFFILKLTLIIISDLFIFL